MRNNLNLYSLKERIFLVKTFYKSDSDPKCVKNRYLLEYGELDGPTDSLILEVISLFEETGSVKDIPEYKELIDPIPESSTLLCEIKVEETEVKTEPEEYFEPSDIEGHSIFSESIGKVKPKNKKKPKASRALKAQEKKITPKKSAKTAKKGKKETRKGKAAEADSEESEYICELCQKKCKSMRGMQIHMSRHRPKELPCRFCKEVFPSKFKRRKHMVEKHKEETTKVKTPAQCPFCPKTFRERSVLRKHLVSHSDKRDAVCEICGKAYKTQQILKLHMRVHTGEEPFKCSFPNCTRTFRIHNSYIIHMRCHNNERPYICTYCGKGFTDRGNLRTHYRVHTGENPYKCELCGKETKQKQNLMSHMVHFHKMYDEDK